MNLIDSCWCMLFLSLFLITTGVVADYHGLVFGLIAGAGTVIGLYGTLRLLYGRAPAE